MSPVSSGYKFTRKFFSKGIPYAATVINLKSGKYENRRISLDFSFLLSVNNKYITMNQIKRLHLPSKGISIVTESGCGLSARCSV